LNLASILLALGTRYLGIMLHKQIKEEIKDALRKRDELRLSVLRGLLTSFTNEVISLKRKPDEELTDEEAMPVIKRAVKQRKESIEQFNRGNRPELAKKEEQELEMLYVYLPEATSTEEIEKVARVKKEEMGINDRAKMGMLMGAVMKDLKGNADGAQVKEIVEGLF